MIRLQTPGGRKSRLLFTLLLFMSFSSCFGEQGYAVFDNSTGTLTFKYGTPTGTLNTDYYNTDNTGTRYPGWYSNCESIKKVVFLSSFADASPKSCYYWFYNCSNLTEINGIEYLNTSNVTNMYGMFMNCTNLTSLTFGENFAANVTNMERMFYNCRSLTSLDVSKFNTANVTTMRSMFSNCSGLTSLTFGVNFTAANVTDMSSMFFYCISLTSLDVTHFNTANVTNMEGMFSNCSGLTSLTFGENFTAANVTNMYQMFYNCSSLTSLDLSKFNTANVKNMGSMFQGCSGLKSLDLSNFDTANVKNMNQMFYNCRGLKSLGVSDFNTANVTAMYSMFRACNSLTSLDVSKFNTEKVTDMGCMFSFCSGLTSLKLSNFDTSNVTNMIQMFSWCSGLTSLNLSNFDTANVNNMSAMFYDCSGLTSLDLSNFNTANVKIMGQMFSGCSSLTSLTFGENLITASCTNFSEMFQGCGKMRYLDFYASNDDNTHAFKEANLNRNGDTYTVLFGKGSSGLPLTTVIYMPHGIKKSDYTNYTDLPNLVFNDGGTLKAANYYSEDKVEIELPREFKTARAEYSRTMSNNYGSVVLPYAFTTDANIQAYTLDEEHTETMYFKDATTVAAHTPFAFKKLQSGNTADFVMTDEGFGITVEATHTTSAKEGGVPFTHNENLGGWTTKGYYINETVTDYTGAFYIAGDKFYKASAALTLYPHRVTFHGAWTKSGTSGEAQFYNINTVSDSETITAIEAADLRHTRSVAAEVYDVAGRRQPEMVKGLNIVRMNDGSVRKVSIR